jgi:membrane protease subunit (stomatin/prohibitin family)
MGLGDFIRKQFVDVIEWTEPEEGLLAYRFPMQDREIQNGARLTVRESQATVFVNEGLVADVFQPGSYRLTTRTLPLLTNLKNWDKLFESPFKSDVYFFSTRLQVNQRWGTATPVTVRDAEFGAIQLRAYGIYSYAIADPAVVYRKLSGTRASYFTADLEGQLKATIVGTMSDAFAESAVPFLAMAANQTELSEAVRSRLVPVFADLGLTLASFVVENISLPDELQQRLQERIGIGMVGDPGAYARFQTARSIPLAAANESSGTAGAGVGLGAGVVMAQNILASARDEAAAPSRGGIADAAKNDAVKYCIFCGRTIPRQATFCAECGKPQS